VDEHDALALYLTFVGAVLQLHAELPDTLLWLDEGAADIVIPDDAIFEGQAGDLRITDGCWHAGVWNGDDHVGVCGCLARQLPAHLFTYLVDGAAPPAPVGAGKVEIFEKAKPAAGVW